MTIANYNFKFQNSSISFIDKNKENFNPNMAKNQVLFTPTAKKTNTLKQNTLKRKLEYTSNKQPPNKKRKITRRYRDCSLAPSIIEELTFKAQGKSDPKKLKNHAYMRMQIFALICVAIYGIGLRSNGKKDDKFNCSLIGAYEQVGRAIHEKGQKVNFNASHDSATAGYIDNRREADIQTTAEEKKVTPKKEARLRAKGLKDEDFEFFKINDYNIAKIEERIDEKWPVDHSRPQSIFTGTYADLVLNSTTETEADVNLIIDKWVELLRGEILELYKKVSYEEILPVEACAQFESLILNHLSNFEKLSKSNLTNLEKYEAEFAKLNQNDDQKRELSEILYNLHKITKELNPPKKKNVLLILPDPLIGQKETIEKTRKVKLNINKKFTNNCLFALQKNHKDAEKIFNNWMLRKYATLKQEFQSQIEKIKSHIEFSELERSGTMPVDFCALFGTYNSNTGKRELTEQSLSDAQKMIWTPINT